MCSWERSLAIKQELRGVDEWEAWGQSCAFETAVVEDVECLVSGESDVEEDVKVWQRST